MLIILKGLCLLFTALFGLTSCSSSSEPTLHLFMWADMISPELIEAFEHKFHCQVTIDTFDSNESMYAKLQLSSAKYDIILPSSYFVDMLAKQNMLKTLDLNLIPNSQHLDPQYLNLHEAPLAIPFLVSFSGIAYRQDKVQMLEPSWSVFARQDLKGRMTMLNDTREALGAALRYLGYSVNTHNAAQIDQAADLLIAWKKNLAKFDNEQYRYGIASGEFLVVQGYSIDVMQVRQDNPHVAFLYPREGAIASIDCLAISQKAENIELAHQFINFMLEAENALQNIAYTNALIPLPSIYEQIKQDVQRQEILFPHAEAREKMETIRDVGQHIDLYYKAWERVKTS